MENALIIKTPAPRVNSRKSVLLVDDNPHRLDRLSTWLEMVNFNVSPVRSASEGLSLAKQRRFDLILINSRLIGYDGAELCRQIRDISKLTPVLLYSDKAESAETQSDWRLTPEPARV
jgi:DNA-binding response OmpR family regulator